MAYKLGANEKRELDKFTKFLALKYAQIIVQSRLGEKVQTPCKTKTSQDWFNLSIPDLPDVLAQAKKAINGQLLTTRLPMCVEISLTTVEGDSLGLESWCLNLLPQTCDPADRITQQVYTRLGTLLKSLVTVTRVTPAYKLSRKQGPDTFVLCYKVYLGSPDLPALGDGFKSLCVGQVCTPIGTLQISVNYRTKMTISPTQTEKGHPIMVKSDHFDTKLSPRQHRKTDEKLSTTAAFADERLRNLRPEIIIPDIPFRNLLPPEAKPDVEIIPTENEVFEESVKKEVSPEESLEDHNGNTPTSESQTSDITMVSTNDDFIMVELKTPFANPNSNTELGQFIKEWQAAPPLKTFTEVPTIAEQVQDLSRQLETYELDMHNYEDVIQSICESPNNN